MTTAVISSQRILAQPKSEKPTAVLCGVDEFMQNGPRSQVEGAPDPHDSGSLWVESCLWSGILNSVGFNFNLGGS